MEKGEEEQSTTETCKRECVCVGERKQGCFYMWEGEREKEWSEVKSERVK